MSKSAFSALFMDELITRAEGKGADKMGQELEHSDRAAKPIPAGGAETAYGNVDEALAKDPAGTMDAAFKKMADDIVKKDK